MLEVFSYVNPMEPKSKRLHYFEQPAETITNDDVSRKRQKTTNNITNPAASSQGVSRAYSDPLQNELQRLCELKNKISKLHQVVKLRLKSDHEKKLAEVIAEMNRKYEAKCQGAEVIAEMNRKYEAKCQGAEAAFQLKRVEIDTSFKKVVMNKMLADAYRSKCQDMSRFDPAVPSGGLRFQGQPSSIGRSVSLSPTRPPQSPSIPSSTQTRPQAPNTPSTRPPSTIGPINTPSRPAPVVSPMTPSITLNIPPVNINPISPKKSQAYLISDLPKAEDGPTDGSSTPSLGSFSDTSSLSPDLSMSVNGTKLRGVRPNPLGKWVAKISVPKTGSVWLGTFRTAEEAAFAFDTAAYMLRGENAHLNFPHMKNKLKANTLSGSIVALLKANMQTVSKEVTNTSKTKDVKLSKTRPSSTTGPMNTPSRPPPVVSPMTPSIRLNIPPVNMNPITPKESQASSISDLPKAEDRPKLRGVRQRPSGKWIAEITLPNRKWVQLGTFHTAEEAAFAFDTAAYWVKGDNAQLNFPHMKNKLKANATNTKIAALLEAKMQTVSKEVANTKANDVELSKSPTIGGGGIEVNAVIGTDIGEEVQLSRMPSFDMDLIWDELLVSEA